MWLAELGGEAADTFQHDLAGMSDERQPWREAGLLRPPARYGH